MRVEPSDLAIDELLSQPESERLEFKREWNDLRLPRERARFAKQVIAMANALRQNESGHIVFGVDDPRRGHEVVGVTDEPARDFLFQVLQTHAHPVPTIDPHLGVRWRDKLLSVVRVDWSKYRPHYATRDVDGTLSTSVVYTRHGSLIGTLRPPDFEAMIREKQAILGPPVPGCPLVVGFATFPVPGTRDLSVRITNVTEEPIDGIHAFAESVRVRPSEQVYRRPALVNLTLAPGESREFVAQPFEDSVQASEIGDKVWDRWRDVRVYVVYRDRDGLFQQLVRQVSLGG